MRSPARSPFFGTALLGCLLQYFGFHWDIAWHVVVGRDSFWLPPHLMVYFGVGLVLVSGLLPIGRGRGRAPRGCYVLALGALAQIVAAPIDDLWHRLYGIDNTLWSPPHLAFILAGSTIPLGLVLLLRDARPAAAPGPGGGEPAPDRGGPFRAGVRLVQAARELGDGSLLLLGLFLAWLDFTLTEFRLHLPPPVWEWGFYLFPPLMIGIALLAGLAGAAATRRVGAVTTVCLSFTMLAIGVNLMLAAFYGVLVATTGLPPVVWRVFPLQTVPLLIPSAIVADLLLARLSRAPLVPRFGVASLAFAAVFYGVQYPYTLFARPAWRLSLVGQSWMLTVLATTIAIAAAPLLGRWLARSAPVEERPSARSSDWLAARPETHLSPSP